MRHGRNTKTYGGTIPAAETPFGVPSIVSREIATNNPKRTMLLIQNTGAGDLRVRFGGPVLGDGTDLIFPGGANNGLLWDKADTCPESSINFASVAGTTYSITEQLTS